MNAILVCSLLERAVDIYGKIKENMEDGKVSESVALEKDISNTYAEIKELIKNDNELSVSEKIEQLKEIADKETEMKIKCDELIRAKSKHRFDVAAEIAKGVVTGGLYYAPDVIRKFKGKKKEKDTNSSDELNLVEPNTSDDKQINEK